MAFRTGEPDQHADATAAGACRHCGQTSPATFCCTGCEGAWEMIHGAGLEEFYARRQGAELLTAAGPTTARDPLADPDLETRYVSATADGRRCTELQLEGITCSACVWLVERIPLAVPEIISAQLDLGRSTVRVVFAPEASLAQIGAVFRRFGFRVRLGEEPELARARRADRRTWVLRIGVAFACLMASMHASVSLYAGILEGMSTSFVREFGLSLSVVCLPVVLYAAVPFYRGALRALRLGRLDIDVLVSVGVVAGYAASLWNAFHGRNETYFEAISMLVAFLLAGRFATRLAEERVQSGREEMIRDLSGELPKARVGDVLEVRPGEPFPCDGEVVEGESAMNAAWLTGEEEAVPLAPGDEVWAGALNLAAPVRVHSLRTGSETRMNRILSQLSSIEKGALQALSGRIESALVLAVFVLVAGYAAWHATTGLGDWNRIVAVLIVACPCALGLAVPSVLATAHRQALRRRVLVKGVAVFEKLGAIRAIVFDKTGTLTESALELHAERWMDAEPKRAITAEAQPDPMRSEPSSPSAGKADREDDARKTHHDPACRADLEALLARLARSSAHLALKPLARRFPLPSAHASAVGRPDAAAPSFAPESAHGPIREIPGRGLETTWHGRRVRLGSAAWAVDDPTYRAFPEAATEVVLALDGRPVAAFALSSRLRLGAREAVAALAPGRDIHVLSGDRSEPVLRAAQAAGIAAANALSGRSPEEKLAFVGDLAARKPTMMVGDGVNDAPALRRAHVAVGVSGGAGAALEACDVYLADADLRRLPELFAAGRAIRRHILLSIVWAALYNGVGIALVLLGFIGPIVCAILMPVSSLTVVGFAVTRRYFGTH